MRLLPRVNQFEERVMSIFYGLLFTSIVTSIFFRVGAELVEALAGEALISLLVGYGALLAAIMMPTAFAPMLGSPFRTMQGMITAAATGAAVSGAMVATAGAGAIGAVRRAGGLRAAFALTGEGIRGRVLGFTSGMRTITAGAISGAVATLPGAVQRGLGYTGPAGAPIVAPLTHAPTTARIAREKQELKYALRKETEIMKTLLISITLLTTIRNPHKHQPQILK